MRHCLPVLLVLGLIAPAHAEQSAPEQTPASTEAPAAAAPKEEAPATEELAALPQLLLPAQPVTPSDPARRPVLPSGFHIRRLDFGLAGVENDTNSSKFREYRSVPGGVVLPFLRFSGEKYRYDVTAYNVLETDARYFVRVEPGPFSISGSFVKIPHQFGNQARSLLDESARGVLSMSDTLQQTFQRSNEQRFAANPSTVNFAYLNSLVTPSLEAEDFFDVGLRRDRGQIELALTRDAPVDVRLSYFHEKRHGTRGSGTSFGFGNVVETPEPIDYRTQDVRLSAEWPQQWGLVRGALDFNQFVNSIPVQQFDNPFRAVSSTDPSAYQAPGSASIGGPAFGGLALPPDNQAVTGSIGAALKFGQTTRLSADASLGQWTQDEPFIPYSTNAAITTPVRATDPAALPARSLDGQIDVFSFSSLLSVRPAAGLGLTARYRRYDLDNQTPRIQFPGYARFDAAWQATGRISVPYGYTNDQLHAAATYDFGRLSVEGGYRYDRMARTFRESEHTSQNTLYASAHVRAADWGVLRATLEDGRREFDHYDFEHSEDASFVTPGAPTNLPSLRRYDQANKDTSRFTGQLELSPGGDTTFVVAYIHAQDDYDESPHGLLNAKNEALTAEADYTPNDRFSLFAFYTREDISSFQRGRQSGSTPSTNPADDWTADIQDKVDSFGAGANVSLAKNVLDLSVTGSWQKVDGNNDLDSPPGGTPDVAVDIAQFDDTKLLTLNAELIWRVRGGWRLAFGGWYEDYEIQDAASTGLTNYVPGSFFLAAIDSDYKAHVLYVRASYSW
jgi:MtrB/PioB family decaheme-associated outer membrane protein